MIRKIEAEDYPRLSEIWESAVSATHDFLKHEDFLYYKNNLSTYFKYVNLFGFEDGGVLTGFVGVADGNIEMLFVDAVSRGKGVGRRLVSYAIDNLQAATVDVNEQNTQAVGFYEHVGFKVSKRSDLDAEGKPYPILHMDL